MPRVVERARVGWPRALRELKDLLYEAYLAAGAPSLDTIARDVARADAEDRAITGTPSRDTVRRCLGDPALPPDRADAVSIAVVLARRAAWDEETWRRAWDGCGSRPCGPKERGGGSPTTTTGSSWPIWRSTRRSTPVARVRRSALCPPISRGSSTHAWARSSPRRRPDGAV